MGIRHSRSSNVFYYAGYILYFAGGLVMDIKKLKFDRKIICPHCCGEQMQKNIPVADFLGDGRVYQCKQCRKDYRVGIAIEPYVSLLRD